MAASPEHQSSVRGMRRQVNRWRELVTGHTLKRHGMRATRRTRSSSAYARPEYRAGLPPHVFVSRITVGAAEVDIYAVLDEHTPGSAHYLLYHRGACLNWAEPFWRLPGARQIRELLALELTPPSRKLSGGRGGHRRGPRPPHPGAGRLRRR